LRLAKTTTTLLPRSAPAAHLRNLVLIRTLVIICLALAALTGYAFFSLHIYYVPVICILLGLSVINLLTWFRLNKPLPVTDIELFTHLIIDVAGLCALLFFVGGASNPFISYLLVPVCITAATLPTRYAWIIATLSLLGYSILLFYHVDQPALAPHHHGDSSVMNLHVIGMWVNFAVSALLISIFITRMAKNLRIQSDRLAQHKEDELRDEQLMAVATLAAGTAHELGTPLSTMKVILHELQQDNTDPRLQEDLNILSDQVEQCSITLRHLVTQADRQRDGQIPSIPLREFCTSLIERWTLMRPEVRYSLLINASDDSVTASFDPTISQSVLNLLHNAADANPLDVQISISWTPTTLTWIIDDNGPGIPHHLSEQLGKAFITTKGKGLGIGFFLTHATVNRYGGQIRLYSRESAGTRTELILPITGNTYELR